MKLTRRQLQRIIIENLLIEAPYDYENDTDFVAWAKKEYGWQPGDPIDDEMINNYE